MRPEKKELQGDLNTLRQHYDPGTVDDVRQEEKFSASTGSSNDSTIGARSPPRYEEAAPTVKISYLRSLLPIDRIHTRENPLKLILRPFPLFFHPAILWACLIQGAMIGWTVMMGVVLAAIFLGPPLWFDEVITGYMYTGPFIGAVIGFIISGAISDTSSKFLTKWNNGVYEPEFRFVLVIPQLVFGTIGLYGFGWAAANVQPNGYVIPDVFFALEVIAMINGAVASSLYIVDAYRDIQVEAFTCLLIFKNVFSFGLTWSAYNWLIHSGQNAIFKIFVALGSVQIVICFLTVPLWFFGKSIRAYMHKHDMLKFCGLK